MYFDTHAHYTDEQFDPDRDEVLASARREGVELIVNAASDLETSLSAIALAEAYPALRASEQYQTLQSGIRDVEEQLQAARRLYNGNVSSLNQLLVTFPSSLVGRHLGMAPRDFFQAEAAKRQDVSMA